MENDKSKFKKEFRSRLYSFTLRLIEYIDHLSSDNVSKRLGDQLLRSGTSIIATTRKVRLPAVRKISSTTPQPR